MPAFSSERLSCGSSVLSRLSAFQGERRVTVTARIDILNQLLGNG
jgi:hypothetical protein